MPPAGFSDAEKVLVPEYKVSARLFNMMSRALPGSDALKTMRRSEAVPIPAAARDGVPYCA
jgi:hypothetical protein